MKRMLRSSGPFFFSILSDGSYAMRFEAQLTGMDGVRMDLRSGLYSTNPGENAGARLMDFGSQWVNGERKNAFGL